MISFETFLYGMLGGLMGMKAFLLGLAALLLVYSLKDRTGRTPGSRVSPRVSKRQPRIDIHV